MKFSINEISKMVKESVRRILSEAISANDAYERFYKGKVDERIWSALMNGVPVMTPFHRAVLNTIVSDNRADLDKKIRCAEDANRTWSKSVKGQQFLTNIASGNYEAFSDVDALLYFFYKFMKKEYHSETEYIDNGFFQLYDGREWRVTCTASYAASQKYYGDSKWCTASDIFGERNGFAMFWRYTCEDGHFLVQFVNKADRTKSYQAAIASEGWIDIVCNFNDDPVTKKDLYDALGDEKDDIFDIIKDKEESLRICTNKMVSEERDYWNFKLSSFIEKNHEKGKAAMRSPEVAEFLIKYTRERYTGQSVAFIISSFQVRRNIYNNTEIYTVYYLPPSENDEHRYQFFNNNITNVLNVIRRSQYIDESRVVYLVKNGSDKPEAIYDFGTSREKEYMGDRILVLGDSVDKAATQIIDTAKCETVYKFDKPAPYDAFYSYTDKEVYLKITPQNGRPVIIDKKGNISFGEEKK